MKYQKVRWPHNFPNEPVWIYEEIGDEGNEQRKVEVYSDGSLGYASRTEDAHGTRLACEPIPSLTTIASNSEFEPTEISHEEFEMAWAKARAKAAFPADHS
jgi:hypothetical protein